MVCTYEDDEVITFLDFIIDTNTFQKIDGKSQSNIKIFDMLAAKVAERAADGEGKSWSPKTGTQWRIKWKSLKSKYLRYKAEASKSGK